MPKRVINLREQQRPLLDIVSYGRGGRYLTPQQREQILLTVRRVPEVMVKVSGGARTLAGVERHMKYIGREGELGLETDMGTRVAGAKFERDLAEDWDLDLEALSRRREGSIRSRRPPKLVHNLIFSMPPGTPPKKVLRAVQRLALNEWQLRHRYAMTLHTDTDHPHVHVVLKAMSEQGERLNIRKATLRAWRSHFAANLRDLGVPANATERAVRGQSKVATSDGIYRTTLRGESSRVETKRREMISEMRTGAESPDAGRDKLRQTRAEVVNGWRALASALRIMGDHTLADGIRIFTGGMSPPVTERELVAQQAMRGMAHGRGRSANPHSQDRTP